VALFQHPDSSDHGQRDECRPDRRDHGELGDTDSRPLDHIRSSDVSRPTIDPSHVPWSSPAICWQLVFGVSSATIGCPGDGLDAQPSRVALNWRLAEPVAVTREMLCARR
jgi:hypothetical protein